MHGLAPLRVSSAFSSSCGSRAVIGSPPPPARARGRRDHLRTDQLDRAHQIFVLEVRELHHRDQSVRAGLAVEIDLLDDLLGSSDTESVRIDQLVQVSSLLSFNSMPSPYSLRDRGASSPRGIDIPWELLRGELRASRSCRSRDGVDVPEARRSPEIAGLLVVVVAEGDREEPDVSFTKSPTTFCGFATASL